MFTHWGFWPVATLERGNRYLNSNLVAFPNRMDGHIRFYADFVKSVPFSGPAWFFYLFFCRLLLLYTCFIGHFILLALHIPYPISILSKLQSNVASVAWHGSLVVWWRILWARSCFMQETIYMVWVSVPEGLPSSMAHSLGFVCGCWFVSALALVHLALICL